MKLVDATSDGLGLTARALGLRPPADRPAPVDEAPGPEDTTPPERARAEAKPPPAGRPEGDGATADPPGVVELKDLRALEERLDWLENQRPPA